MKVEDPNFFYAKQVDKDDLITNIFWSDAKMMNASKNLSVVFGEFQYFNKNFSKCIYEYEEEGEFIKVWDDLLDNYGLRGNIWMNKSFALKGKWASVYGRKNFVLI
ncbi:hypothetical protein Lal_00043202 [Lupinus albus]|nr:hypothetical protein Lal_00043202 [Lupinus albus]